jgi:hypothetical protein
LTPNACVAIAVRGTPPSDFQWKRNGFDFRARFSIEVRNSYGRVTSGEALLTVTPP